MNDGIYLYHHIMGLPIKVTMHNTGHVGSIATTIFAAAERRIAAARSTFMIHPVGIQPNGNLGHAGRTALLELAAADEARIEAILRARSNIPEDVLTRRRGTEIYFTGDEALKHGLVTEVGEFALPPGNKVFHL